MYPLDRKVEYPSIDLSIEIISCWGCFILMFYASHSSSYDRFLTWGYPKMDGL